MGTIEEQSKYASINRLGTHAVGIVNGVRTVGYDPTTRKQGDTEEPGTGCAGRWGGHHFILTAKHVVEKAELRDLRFFCNPSSRVEDQPLSNLRERDIVEALPLDDQNAAIHRCKWEDLAVIVTIPKAVPNIEFFDSMNEWIDPPTSEKVHCIGFPSDSGQIVQKKMVGSKEERTIVLYATFFSATVLPLPTERELKFTFTDFDTDRHYLVPYDDAARGKHPRGISGAAMWWESHQKEIIWRPNFKFAGVCTASFKSGTVVQVVKASVVRRFLEEVFEPAA